MATTPTSERLTSSEFTQQTMFNDLLNQRWLIGAGIGIGVLMLMLLRRPPAQEKAARRMVRDLRHIDDIDDARDLFGSNLPVIVRPALMMIMQEIERQVERGFRTLERSIERL